jgi:hypothetical protein
MPKKPNPITAYQNPAGASTAAALVKVVLTLTEATQAEVEEGKRTKGTLNQVSLCLRFELLEGPALYTA